MTAKIWNILDLIRPKGMPIRENLSVNDINRNISKSHIQQRHYYKGKLCKNIKIGEVVLVKDYRAFKTKWCLGTIVRKLGNTIYYVQLKDSDLIWKRHANQLLKNNVNDVSVYLLNVNLPAKHQEHANVVLDANATRKSEINVDNKDSDITTTSESESSVSSFGDNPQVVVNSSPDSLVEVTPKRPVRKRVKPDRLQINH